MTTLNTLIGVFGGGLFLTIAFLVQPFFVWLAVKCVQLDCTLMESITVAGICAVLLTVPYVGVVLSICGFFILLIKGLRAEFNEAFVAFSVILVLQAFLIGVGVHET